MNPIIIIGSVGLLSLVVWFTTLIAVLERKNWSDTDRIVWTVVLCTLNILGAILYILVAPPDPANRSLSDEELAEHCNNDTLKKR